MLISRDKMESFDWQNLKGKTIMSWRKGSAPALFLEHILRSKGFNLQTDVTIINNIAAPARHGAFVAGKADFATFFEPDVSKMAFSKTGHFVTSIGRQVGNIDYTVFMATQSFIDKKPEVIQAWTNAIAKAQKYSLEADAAVIAGEVAPFFPKIKEEFIAQSIDRYRQLSILKSSPLVEPAAIKALQDLLVEGGLLKPEQRVNYKDIVVTRFAEKAIGQN